MVTPAYTQLAHTVTLMLLVATKRRTYKKKILTVPSQQANALLLAATEL
jgi:hypothetical protein